METTSDSQPPRKRLRVSEDDHGADVLNAVPNSTVIELTRSPDYWFDDGSIILEAESAQFRVHRTMLARHSSVFRDMFEIPQPAHGEPVVEGCLVVHISDSAEDIKHMLCSLYDKSSEIEHPEFASIAAKLRIGKKYGIDYQYNEALKYLQSKLPSSLEKYQTLQSKPNHRDFRYSPSILLDVIRLALETNTFSILPAAYLHLGDMNVKTIFDGFARADSSLATIPLDAQHICIQGKESVLNIMSLFPYGWVVNNTHCCQEVMHNVQAWLWQNARSPYTALQTVDEIDGYSSFCIECQAGFYEAHEFGRAQVWASLPKVL